MSDAIATADPPASATVLDRLKSAPAPMTAKELATGLQRPKKVSAAAFEKSLADGLADDLQAGRVFKYGSGPKGVDRYWARDERHAIREAVVAAAATPTTVADLVKKATATVAKVDKGFAEGVVRELIGEDALFEYPPKKKSGQPLFGAEKPVPPPPPPHPLEVGKAKKEFDKLVAAAKKLLESVEKVTPAELLTRLGGSLNDGFQATAGAAALPGGHSEPPTRPQSVGDTTGLEQRILDIVRGVPAMLLSDLRPRLPAADRGAEFDAAVIRLAEGEKVVINDDADPRRFGDEERSRFVRDEHGRVYTTISKRS